VKLAAGALLLSVWLLGAGVAHAQGGGEWRGRGVVLALLPPPSSLHAERPVILIEHEPIPGLMADRMSMPFIAASTTLFDGLRPGDRVAFELKETPGALLVIAIERLPPPR
jgi:Copper binding periplasmic protein CusF